MNKPYFTPARQMRRWVSIPLLFVGMLCLALTAQAQEGSQGNTTIFNGAEMTFFGNHNFLTGGGGTQPGIIGTLRTAPFGILNFATTATTTTGANDANHVDGYVRKFGTSQFIFPTGDNGHFGPFAAAADGTMGAYFFTDPNTAITSQLGGGNYPVLPSGGPFDTFSMAPEIGVVSTKEYWDIDGSNATKITLTWSALSDITTLTSSQLSRLTIAGWNGTQWVAIPSTVDVTSVLGGASGLTAGSITSDATIVPGTFVAYTFASLGPDLTPVIFARPSTVNGTKPITVVVDVFELLGVSTVGTVTLRVSKDPKTALTFNPTATSVGGRPVNNSAWTFDGVSNANFYILKTTQVIPAGGQLTFGLDGTLTPGATSGTLTISTVIIGGSGGESRSDNNADADKIDFFQ
ncbi:hypothetical protein [Spirosoma koreense]